MSQYQTFRGGGVIIDGCPEVEEPCMFKRVMYFYVFYCLCCVKEISIDMLEEQGSEERDLGLNEEENIIMGDSREDHWRDVAQYCSNKKNISDLRWGIYTREKEDMINKQFLVSVLHPKGGNMLWTCVKDNTIE